VKIGTKSVLFGAHAFWFHPFFVARAWYHLYGFPFDPRLWVAFFVHDIGYLGKPNMDGPEGESHPEIGATIISWLFDRIPWWTEWQEILCGSATMQALEAKGWLVQGYHGSNVVMSKPHFRWYEFCLYHSRHYTKKTGGTPSKLCFADKLSFCYTPRWAYLPMVKATGELTEYLENAKKSDSPNWKPCGDDPVAWHNQLSEYMAKWVETHKDGAVDTWTDGNRNAAKVAA
jgi:hypothetical protein